MIFTAQLSMKFSKISSQIQKNKGIIEKSNTDYILICNQNV